MAQLETKAKTNPNLPKPITPQQALESALTQIPAELAKITVIEPKPELPVGPKKAEPVTLVHIQQLHGNNVTFDVSRLPKELVEASRRLLPMGQKQQGQILDVLVNKAGVKEAYLENMPPATLEYFTNLISMLQGQEGKILSVVMERTKAETPEQLRKYLEVNKNSKDPLVLLLKEQAERTWIPLMEGRQQLAEDFMLRAAYYGKVKILASEDPKLHQAALDMVKNNPGITFGEGGDLAFNNLQNQRDAYFLSQMVKSGKPVSVIALGAGHSLRDEVAAHNKANPNKPIRLVEILPKAAEEFLKYAEKK
ncbi:MAG: hypothetical protein KBC84_07745 [Proteobacteria bacterium]|nr:hypothetical protein [Pseudomonadota bacterium]